MALGDSWRRMMGGAKGLAGSLTGYPVAIDFGTGALKVLQVVAGEPLSLVAAASLTTPDELLSDAGKRLAFQLDALPKLVKSCEFKTRRAVCAIPASQAYCKHMQFQLEPGVTIAALVRSAVPGEIGCDPSALVYRHVEVGQIARSTKTEVICMAAGRELVERLMKAVKESKLEPVGMHIEYSAALRAFDSITRRDEDKKTTSLYLDIGAGSTKVVMAHGRDMVFARTIDLGGRHLDAAIAKQLKIDLAEARAHRLAMAEVVGIKKSGPVAQRQGGKAESAARASVNGSAHSATLPLSHAATSVEEDRRQGGLPRGMTPDLTSQPRMDFEPARADLSEPLEILTDEISMCLRYHESVFPDRRADRAIFFGGEARHVGLCQHIARTLRLPAQVADPMAGVARTGQEPTVGIDFRQSQPGWAMTLGLCLSPTDL
jgi:type IV pilus assembly protein PilM